MSSLSARHRLFQLTFAQIFVEYAKHRDAAYAILTSYERSLLFYRDASAILVSSVVMRDGRSTAASPCNSVFTLMLGVSVMPEHVYVPEDLPDLALQLRNGRVIGGPGPGPAAGRGNLNVAGAGGRAGAGANTGLGDRTGQAGSRTATRGLLAAGGEDSNVIASTGVTYPPSSITPPRRVASRPTALELADSSLESVRRSDNDGDDNVSDTLFAMLRSPSTCRPSAPFARWSCARLNRADVQPRHDTPDTSPDHSPIGPLSVSPEKVRQRAIML